MWVVLWFVRGRFFRGSRVCGIFALISVRGFVRVFLPAACLVWFFCLYLAFLSPLLAGGVVTFLFTFSSFLILSPSLSLSGFDAACLRRHRCGFAQEGSLLPYACLTPTAYGRWTSELDACTDVVLFCRGRAL